MQLLHNIHVFLNLWVLKFLIFFSNEISSLFNNVLEKISFFSLQKLRSLNAHFQSALINTKLSQLQRLAYYAFQKRQGRQNQEEKFNTETLGILITIQVDNREG